MAIAVKICGVTGEANAAEVAAAGADSIGLNLWPGSRRKLDLATAARLAAAARSARPGVVIVGVFVDASEDEIDAAMRTARLDRVQLHGDEPDSLIARFGAAVIHGIGVGERADLARALRSPAPVILVDTPSSGKGGSGVVGDWRLAAEAVSGIRARGRQAWLAGGLTAANVGAAIAAVRPDGVDVASGVERAPGDKDPDRVTAFIRAARAAGETLR